MVFFEIQIRPGTNIACKRVLHVFDVTFEEVLAELLID